jgi:serralysin
LRSFYVSTTGSDSNAGTSARPFKTINHALGLSYLTGGDCVVVLPGIYDEAVFLRKSGTNDSPTGYVALVSQVPRAARIRASVKSDSTGIYIGAMGADHHIIVDGFTVSGGKNLNWREGIFILQSHHIMILNNHVHHVQRGGIEGVYSDHITIDRNIIHDTSKESPYNNQTSGISLYQARAVDDAPGWHNIITRNISFNSMRGDTGTRDHSDGNGIIIDDFRNTQGGSTAGVFRYPTLVENNLAFNNGGSGIHAFFSDHVTVINNTVFNNNLDPMNPGTYRGNLSNAIGSDNTWVNNISVANPDSNSYNTAMADYSIQSAGMNQGVYWMNNALFNGTPGQSSTLLAFTQSTVTTQNGNLIGVDPRFARSDKQIGSFHLQRTSPALGAGTDAFGFPKDDLTGRNRRGNLDLGAYAYTSD